MAIDTDILRFLRSTHRASAADAALRLPVSALLGASTDAASALG